MAHRGKGFAVIAPTRASPPPGRMGLSRAPMLLILEPPRIQINLGRRSMGATATESIRAFALVGHAGSGKTLLT